MPAHHNMNRGLHRRAANRIKDRIFQKWLGERPQYQLDELNTAVYALEKAEQEFQETVHSVMSDKI